MRRLATLTTGFAVLAFAVLVGAVPAAASSVLEVPVAFPTIQAAINAAVNGDTVLVDPGTYFENIDFKGKLITVQSAKGPSVTTIDGGNAAPVVNFSTSETTAAVLQGFTIQHGNGTANFQYTGGGVRISSASPTVIGNVITANVACSGGAGIAVLFASPLIQDNTINGNSTLGCSGGMGGGIDVQGAASAQIVHNVITNNASDFGGGISLFASGTPTLLNNTISNNNGRTQGGAIYAVNQSDANIIQNLVIGNSAPSGGGFYVSPPQGTRGALLVNNTIIGNPANDSGVLLSGFDASVELTNNIVVSYAAQPALLCNPGATPILDHNDFFNPSAASSSGACAQAVVINGNFGADPQFASSNDAHLKSTSPAVDAGNSSAPSLPATDLDGNPRITGPAVDLGVYEQVNPPLVLTAAASLAPATEGAAYSAVLATFAGGRGPFSATVNWGDGQTSAGTISGASISGTHTYAEEGGFSVSVSVADSIGATASGAVAVSVNDAPITGTGVQVVLIEGTAFSGPLATFQDADPGGTLSDYTATIDWRDGTTSPGVIAVGAGGIQVSGTHTYAEEGSYNLSVVLTDAGGAFGSAGPQIVAQDAPLSSAGISFSTVEGTSFSGNLATFSDSDPNATLSDYTASIQWGDGSSSAGTITADGHGGYIVAGSHAYLEEGTFTIQVFPLDVGGAGAPTSATVVVSDAPLSSTAGPSISATESATVSGVLATFNDSDPNASAADYTATVDWGDGTTSAGTIAATSGGGFTVNGSHVYEEGSFAVKVTIADAGGATTTATTSASIADAAITGTGKQLPITTEANPFTGPVATFSDSDPLGVLSDYTATIAWGDGTTSAATLVNGSNLVQASGTHTYAEEGNYNVTVTLTDAGGAVATAVSPMNVSDASLSGSGITFSPVEGTTFSGNVGTFTDSDPNGTLSDYSAVITWGDATSSSGTITPDGHGGYIVSGSHLYLDEGVYNVSVIPSDVGGAAANITMTITVGDAPLTSSPGAALRATEGSSATGVVATFDDPAPSGTSWTATIDWGDQTTSLGTVATGAFGGFTVTGTHTYAEEGSYPVNVTITDDGGATTTTSTSATVSDAALSATGKQLSEHHDTTFTATIATLSDADPGGVATDYSGVINWGDGTMTSCPSGSCAIVRQSDGTFSISASHRFRKNGKFTVTIQLTDAGGSTVTTTTTISVG